jgi:hypothetical protein
VRRVGGTIGIVLPTSLAGAGRGGGSGDGFGLAATKKRLRAAGHTALLNPKTRVSGSEADVTSARFAGHFG